MQHLPLSVGLLGMGRVAAGLIIFELRLAGLWLAGQVRFFLSYRCSSGGSYLPRSQRFGVAAFSSVSLAAISQSVQTAGSLVARSLASRFLQACWRYAGTGCDYLCALTCGAVTALRLGHHVRCSGTVFGAGHAVP